VPTENLGVLKELLAFLQLVVKHSAQNKMHIHNLATVFAPNLLRMREENVIQIVQDTPKINTVTVNLILHQETLFQVCLF
jgi:hypothetical protein